MRTLIRHRDGKGMSWNIQHYLALHLSCSLFLPCQLNLNVSLAGTYFPYCSDCRWRFTITDRGNRLNEESLDAVECLHHWLVIGIADDIATMSESRNWIAIHGGRMTEEEVADRWWCEVAFVFSEKHWGLSVLEIWGTQTGLYNQKYIKTDGLPMKLMNFVVLVVIVRSYVEVVNIWRVKIDLHRGPTGKDHQINSRAWFLSFYSSEIGINL